VCTHFDAPERDSTKGCHPGAVRSNSSPAAISPRLISSTPLKHQPATFHPSTPCLTERSSSTAWLAGLADAMAASVASWNTT